ncbi:ABC transporter permease [Acrocarpospora macrocephala]|uniref:Peptide ABC transporter permease n=1 Tax=Acrocarpospora macrocephala TaxID=150177 RepID=A0A5M3X0G7_9ACTN|nr:ABC transporter permease [Acrocarpospora macrocephala]GES11768.1 peptide ABC transporter permease [Acrocarpospora macrocephala]
MTARLPATASRTECPPTPAAPRSAPGQWARRGGLLCASVFLLLVGVAAAWPGLLSVHVPDVTDLSATLQGASPEHLLGTDRLGRDTLSRLIYGARISLLLGLTATGLGFLAGLVWGLTAGLSGRVVDEVAMRSADVFMSVPSMLMVLLVIAIFGAGERNAALAVAVGIAPGFARLVRGQTLVVKNTGYVAAAVSLGLPARAVILRHIVPNVLPPLFVYATMTLGQTIIVGASLSFLGLGPQPPAPEWGLMLAEARGYLQRAPLLGVYPGLAITLTVLSIATVGRALQLRFEGRDAR